MQKFSKYALGLVSVLVLGSVAFGISLVNHSPKMDVKNPTVSGLSTNSSKSVLTANDFKYVGAFAMPTSGVTGDPGWGGTLAMRKVGSELRFFSRAHAGNVYEVKAPNPSSSKPYPVATVVREWSGVGQGTSSGEFNALYWDETDQRLYYNFGNMYNTTDPDMAGLGYSVLNDSNGSVANFGPWRFTGRGNKMTNTCTFAIPSWFANAYTSGRRIGVGCGGYQSIAATGPVSSGPAATAVNPPNPNSNPASSSLSFTNLVGYPFGGTPAQRNSDYNSSYGPTSPNPSGSIGYWNWSDDGSHQNGLWVDTPTKSGLMFFATLAKGRAFYQTSSINAQNHFHAWYVYNPDDLAAVAQGTKSQSQIQANYWNVEYPNFTSTLR